jgi:hypothetical protein
MRNYLVFSITFVSESIAHLTLNLDSAYLFLFKDVSPVQFPDASLTLQMKLLYAEDVGKS